MDLRELLRVLEMDSPEDFQYFEDLEALVSMTEEVPYETLYQFIKSVDAKTLSSIIRDYFEEIEKGVPDNAAEFYTLIDTIKMALAGMAAQMEEEDDIVRFCEEFDRFRQWYMISGEVLIRPEDCKGFRSVTPETAMTMVRAEKLMPEIGMTEYDFNPALGYELRDYIISFKDAFEASEDYEGE